MAKITVDSRGVVVTRGGSGLVINSEATFNRGLKKGVFDVTEDDALERAGVYRVSGSAAVTLSLPDPSSVPGADFIIRTLSADAHVLTCSEVTYKSITDGTNVGTKVTFPTVKESSVYLISDGYNYLIQVGSGSITIS